MTNTPKEATDEGLVDVLFKDNYEMGDVEEWMNNARNVIARSHAAGYAAGQRERQEKYQELILSIENKFEGETRHQTALRFIRQAQANLSTPAQSQ